MASVLPLSRYRLSVDQFQEMGRVGILGQDSRVELIDGELIDMAPIGSRHASVVSLLSMALARGCGDLIVWSQNPIVLPPYSEPQPDVVLLATSVDSYRGALPAPGDVLLVIEVAESTLRYDRSVKLPLYARHGIPEVWIVDLADSRLEVFQDPDEGVYRSRRELESGDAVSPTALPTVLIELAAVFPD